jgi:hypothetical protein
MKPTTTPKPKPKHVSTTTTTHEAQAGDDSPVNAFSEANVSTPTPAVEDPNDATPTPDQPEEPIPDQPASPTSSSSNAGVAAAAAAAGPTGAPSGSDPNEGYTETQAVKNDGSTNTSLGLGLGLGVGCVAALGLAGLLVHNRRRHQQQEDQLGGETPRGFNGDPAPFTSSFDDASSPQQSSTKWRPQSFMGVVASVVAKLPRSPSQRSCASTGMAVGSGTGAVELARHPSDGSMRSYGSQPPALARVDEEEHRQHYQY